MDAHEPAGDAKGPTARPGGGAATAGGIGYQARVAAWISTCILAGDQAASPWGLPAHVRLDTIWCETDQPVDDLRVATSVGGFAFLQAKRRLDLGSRPESELASALDQCVRQLLSLGAGRREGRPWERRLDPTRDRLVLVAGPESSEPIRVHLPILVERLRAATPGQGFDVAKNRDEEDVLAVFLDLLAASFKKHRRSPPTDKDIAQLSEMLHIHILAVEPGGEGESLALDRLRHQLRQPDLSDAAWALLVASALRWAQRRGGAHRAGLADLLFNAGLPLRGMTLEQPALSTTRLLAICGRALPDQIRRLGRGNYAAELFVPRRARRRIDDFLDADTRFRVQAASLLDRLRAIAVAHDLGTSAIDSLLAQDAGPRLVEEALDPLRRTFRFAAVEKALALAERAIQEPLDSAFARQLVEILTLLETLPAFNQARLKQAAQYLNAVRRSNLSGGRGEMDGFWSLLPSAPSGRDWSGRELLANSLLQELETAATDCAARCLAIVGSAGYGKTSLLCSLADELGRETPTVLLSGEMTISSEYDVETHIQRLLERELGEDCRDWLRRVANGLNRTWGWLFILIDALNENTDPVRMARAVDQLVNHCRWQRVKVIVSCRDVHWPVFASKLQPLLTGKAPLILDEFSPEEQRQAMALYFEKFQLRCQLGPDAAALLKNPLLLSLFCRSNQGRDLGIVADLRALDVFDRFMAGATAGIVLRAALAGSALVDDLLWRIGSEMWRRRRTALRHDEAGITPREQSDPLSVYNQLRSEGILAANSAEAGSAAAGSSAHRLHFVYEAVAEYMIARAWAHHLEETTSRDTTLGRLLEEAIEALPSFASTLGALLFLDRMQAQSGEVLSRVISLLARRDDAFLAAQQPVVVAVFENLVVEKASDEAVFTLARFEALADPISRDALAPVVLRLLQHRREHPLVRSLALRLIEIDPGLLGAVPSGERSEDTENGTAQGKRGPGEDLSSPPHSGSESVPLALPPARHHYPREARLTALSLLVTTDLDAPLEIFLQGARKLGSVDLRSALEAFRALDRATDGTLFAVIDHQIVAGALEYRIYCAWLLRERYGRRPADFLVRLLTDPVTRVHRYALRLFRERAIEPELIEAVLAKLDGEPSLAAWHRTNLLTLLGSPERFRPPSLGAAETLRIRDVLSRAATHASPAVRKAAYQVALQYVSSTEILDLRRRIAADPSLSVRGLA